MDKEEQVKETLTEKPVTAMTTTENKPVDNLSPIFVEAEKMFERFADLTRETAHKAYEFFLKRGGSLGRELDDWFRAEAEILRPVAVEINETDKAFKVTAAVPGFKPEEIEISVKDQTLILSGKTETKTKKEEENTVYSEWRSNRFFRQLELPAEVEADKVKANLKDGILHLTLPKAAPREARQIAVSAG